MSAQLSIRLVSPPLSVHWLLQL